MESERRVAVGVELFPRAIKVSIGIAAPRACPQRPARARARARAKELPSVKRCHCTSEMARSLNSGAFVYQCTIC